MSTDIVPAVDLYGVEALWTVDQCAAYLNRSPRWLYDCLQVDAAKPGSVPFVRIPGGRGRGRGVNGAVRFIPEDVRAWVAQGCPPVAIFKCWQADHLRNRKKSG